MIKKSIVIEGAGPCGLVALEEMREAGHMAVALDKGPAIGGVFRAADDADDDERAASEGADEDALYVHDRHSPNRVDYPAVMDSVARLIGCLPQPPCPPPPRGCSSTVVRPRPSLRGRWALKAKKHLLHDNA